MCKRTSARVECYTCGYPQTEARYLLYDDGMCRDREEPGFPDPGCWKERMLRRLCKIGIHQWVGFTCDGEGRECSLCSKEKYYA